MEKKTNEFYESPRMKVMEVKVRGTILATSKPNSTDPYGREDW